MLYLAIDKMDAKVWQVLESDKVCGVNEVYPNCSTLETVADKSKENEIMQIDINISQLTLVSTMKFTKLNSLTIKSVLGLTTIKCTDSNAGILLSDIEDTIVLN